MRLPLVYIVVLFLFWGCSNEESPEEKLAKKYVPPADGRITQEMVDAYVMASKYVMEAITNYQKAVEELAQRHKISSDMLSDSTYLAKHPEVKRSFERSQGNWRKDEADAYKKAGIGEEEFTWIGSALTDTLNKDIQVQVEQRLADIIKQ